MKALLILASVALSSTAAAQSLRLILAPQQLVIPRDGAPTKFDVYLYNDGKTAQSVPSLDTCTIFYSVHPTATDDEEFQSVTTKFSRPIKDHVLRPRHVDHATIEVDLDAKDGDFIEAYVVVGNRSILTSNYVLLLCRKP